MITTKDSIDELRARIKAHLEAIDDAYFYSKRAVTDRIDYDERMERLRVEVHRVTRQNESRLSAIKSRRRELKR